MFLSFQDNINFVQEFCFIYSQLSAAEWLLTEKAAEAASSTRLWLNYRVALICSLKASHANRRCLAKTLLAARRCHADWIKCDLCRKDTENEQKQWNRLHSDPRRTLNEQARMFFVFARQKINFNESDLCDKWLLLYCLVDLAYHPKQSSNTNRRYNLGRVSSTVQQSDDFDSGNNKRRTDSNN